MRVVRIRTELSRFIVSIFLFCLFHFIFISSSFASGVETTDENVTSNSETILPFSSENGNLPTDSTQELSFTKGISALSSSAKFSEPEEVAFLTVCVTIGTIGAIIGGGKYLAGYFLGFHGFDWYELASACIVGAASAIATIILTAITPPIVAAVLGAAAADHVGLTQWVQSKIADALRWAVSEINELNAGFSYLRSVINSSDTSLEEALADDIQDLIDSCGDQYQDPGFDSRWVDFSTEILDLYEMTCSVDFAGYNSAYGNSWRLPNPGFSQITLNFNFVDTPSSATLMLTHLSSASENCPGGGYSPVDIYINDNLLEDNYDVAENHCYSHGFKTDRWDISDYISTKNNLIIKLEDNPLACSHYWIQNVTIIPGAPTIENRPSYFISIFSGRNGSVSPNDLQTVSECDDIVLTATPENGYLVDSWYLDGLVNQVGSNEFTISQIQSSHTVYVTFKPTDATNIEVIAPDGDEVWFAGRNAYISWQWNGNISENIKLDLYKGATFDTSIATVAKIHGAYQWSIPHELDSSCNYQVKISSSDDNYSDFSNGSFCIIPWIQTDTIKIYTAEQLQNISTGGIYPRDGYYLLMNDIDVSGSGITNFDPIGSDYQHYFRGTFDGQGFTIRDLKINLPSESLIGLFSVITDVATIKNLNIEDNGIYGLSSVGVLGGECAGTIINCHILMDDLEGRGGSNIGGLVGENTGTGVILNCSMICRDGGDIEAEGSSPSNIGGLVGLNSGIIRWCKTDGRIDAWSTSNGNYGNRVGGIAGSNYGTIKECYSDCFWIQGEYWTGGIVGNQVNGEIRDCYFSGGDVDCDIGGGGVVGKAEGGNISNCYVTAACVDANSKVGALVGENTGVISNSFWCTCVNQPTGDDGGSLDSCRELCDSMLVMDPFLLAGWDFDNVWAINSGISPPELRGVGDTLSRPNMLSASTDQDSGVYLSWNPVTYELSGSQQNALYSVFRSESSYLDEQTAQITEWLSEISYIDTSAIPGITYYYRIKAASTPNGARESEFSYMKMGKRLYPPLETPSNITASDSLPLSVLIEWNSVTNGNYYRVYRSQTSNGTKTGLNNWASELSYIDSPPYADTVYYYWVKVAVDDTGGRASDYGGPASGYCVNPPTDISDDEIALLPTEFSISQNYPNPFNPKTRIAFDLPERSHVRLTVYNVLGQVVNVLMDCEMSAGYHTIEWDGKNRDGNCISTGVYLYRIEADGFMASKKMLLLK